jgi:hypothetical protein
MNKIVVILALMVISGKAVGSNMCSMTPGITAGFDTILNTYATITMNWAVLILPKAETIFGILFTLEFLYQLTVKKIIAFDIQKLYVFFIVRIFTAYLFMRVFLNIKFYTGIVTYFTSLGSYLGGSAITMSGGSSGMAISPSSILNFLECQFAIPATALAGASFSPLGGQLFAMLLFAILFLIISIPVTLMITMIDAYVVIFGGFILCGFSGSSWTQSYWQKYLSYVGGVAIRLFVTCLVLGVVIQSFSILNQMTIPTITTLGFNTHVPDPVAFTTYIEAMFGLLFFNVVAMVTIPNKAAGMLTSSINSGLAEVINGASMMMAGMGGISSISNAAKSLGSGVIGAPAAMKSAIIDTSKELSGASGTPSDWKAATKTAGVDAAREAARDSIKSGWNNALDNLRGSSNGNSNSKGISQLGSAAKQATGMSGGHGGASELNVNAHKE